MTISPGIAGRAAIGSTAWSAAARGPDLGAGGADGHGVSVDGAQRRASASLQSRPRKLLTVVTKRNAQRHAMVVWDEIAVQVATEFPDVRWDKELVDAMTARMAADNPRIRRHP